LKPIKISILKRRSGAVVYLNYNTSLYIYRSDVFYTKYLKYYDVIYYNNKPVDEEKILRIIISITKIKIILGYSLFHSSAIITEFKFCFHLFNF